MPTQKDAKHTNPHRGSNLDEFLREEGVLEEVELAALKRTLAMKLEALMTKRRLSKTDMARKMGTSRAALDRLLDPDSTAVTLHTLSRAANAVGRRVKVDFVAA